MFFVLPQPAVFYIFHSPSAAISFPTVFANILDAVSYILRQCLSGFNPIITVITVFPAIHITIQRATTMANTLSIGDLPYEVRREILVRLDDLESLRVVAQSCKAFHDTLLVYPSTIRHFLERQIPTSLIPLTYAVLKCEKEGLGTASDEEKRRFIDTVFRGEIDFAAYFPGSELIWASARDIISFFKLVERHTRRAVRYAADKIRDEAAKFNQMERIRFFRCRKSACWSKNRLTLSETETLRFYLAFYRAELHCRLFSTTHGAELDGGMEQEFMDRLKPWEVEQCMILQHWMGHRASTNELGPPTSWHPQTNACAAVWPPAQYVGTRSHYRSVRFLDSGHAVRKHLFHIMPQQKFGVS